MAKEAAGDDRPDIAAARLPAEAYRANFADIHPRLERKTALVEANRCYFCYDAPCIEACPTGIDIPGFIKQIATDNVEGSGLRILEANIFGGACARVCPTDVLCEGACVRMAQEGKPIQIGRLQRYATDHVLAAPSHPFTRAAHTGKRIAIVGGGPAGLSCAHRLALLGHDAIVFEARERLGGLNEYGVAEYKVADRFARREVEFVLDIGGIEVRTREALGDTVSLAGLRRDFAAVFLGIGLAGVNALGSAGEELAGVHDAVDYIAKLRQAENFAGLPVGRRIVVIGGGNTAIDIAVQTKRLGAEDVTMVYRRGPEAMGATDHEQEFAQINGVKIKHWARPQRLVAQNGHVAEAVFEYTRLESGKLVGAGATFSLSADMVFKAIGQMFVADPIRADGRDFLEVEAGRIKVDADRRTSLAKVWAGGDCVAGGQDLTVQAVQDGKVAAQAIDRALRAGGRMADLATIFAGIKSPNPFWLASAPPTDKAYNVVRAFEAGWGGVVWKTLGEAGPPVVNTSSRYGAISYKGNRVVGFTNIELITDRPLEVNLREIKEVKRDWPDRALVVSLMVPCDEASWKRILVQVEDTGADGVELDLGCPHGMSERGMGAAVGQVPEYVEMVTRWCKQNTRLPVIVKLTPNVTNILGPARAAVRGGADAVSLINTVNSIIAVDLDEMAPAPVVDGKGTHGGYCGPAVKPIALNMVAEIARDPECRKVPISGIGGIETWRDAAEFMALGAGTVQVCTAAMHYGFRVVDDMVDGLARWMRDKGHGRLADFCGRAVPNVTDWQFLNLNYQIIADIDQALCIKCGLCHIACEDTAHQAIAATRVAGERRYEVIDEECVGCNLCLYVCPVENCITMRRVDDGRVHLDWTQHPNNPMRKLAE